MKVALEMVPISAAVLGIDTPKDLPSYQETVMPSMVTTSRGTVDRVWVRMRGDVSHLGSLCPNGPRGDMRHGHYDDAIMFGPWAQWGWGIFDPYNIYIYNYKISLSLSLSEQRLLQDLHPQLELWDHDP